MYFVSCSTILTQIDWICFDITNKKFFISDKNNNYSPEAMVKIKKNINSSLFIDTILNESPIRDTEKNLKKYSIRLNRHEIIHWIDYKYWTKLNNLKLISLLVYVSNILNNSTK